MLSVIIPTHNDSRTIYKTIESLYNSIDNFELFIINDYSTDNTLGILKKLRKKYVFKIINNESNLGKTESINRAIKRTRGKILLILDSDTTLNKESVNLALLNLKKEEIGAVSCRYKVTNKGIIPHFISLEFAMLSLANSISPISLWGGCIFVKKESLKKVGLFKKNMITEDMDLALSLQEENYKVKQIMIPVETEESTKPKSWLKQKIRWASGGMQCMLKHPKQMIKKPYYLIFLGLYNILSSLFFISIFNFSTINSFLLGISYLTLTSVFPLLNINKIDELNKVIWAIPYAFIYYPIFSFISTIGFIIGIYKFIELKKGVRAW